PEETDRVAGRLRVLEAEDLDRRSAGGRHRTGAYARGRATFRILAGPPATTASSATAHPRHGARTGDTAHGPATRRTDTSATLTDDYHALDDRLVHRPARGSARVTRPGRLGARRARREHHRDRRRRRGHRGRAHAHDE